jgi:hypothetical protein
MSIDEIFEETKSKFLRNKVSFFGRRKLQFKNLSRLHARQRFFSAAEENKVDYPHSSAARLTECASRLCYLAKGYL